MKKLALLSAALLIPFSTPLNAQNLFPDKGIMSGKVGIFNCDADGNKQMIGAAAGAALGGLIGNKISKDNKTLGTVLGAAAGAAAGSYIGCTMQRKDQEKIAFDSEKAFALGQNSTYVDSATGMTINTSVVTTTSSANASVRHAANVDAPKSLTLLGGKYVLLNDANIRSKPSTKGKVLGKALKGQSVDVLGRTNTATDFAAITENGVITGYIYFKALNPEGKIITNSQSAQSNYRTSNISVTTMCRDVSQIATKNGKQLENGKAQAKGCIDTDGNWKTI